MSGFPSLFSLNSPIVKKLVGWRQSGDDEKWATKAVDILVKKLKKNKSAIDDLEVALANPGLPSVCVTIPRSADGRLQVSHKKAYPHVIYCKLWRWPDLQSHHELEALETCEFTFLKKHPEVCINPYHYTRVEKPSLPPVLVPRYSSHFSQSMSSLCMPRFSEGATPNAIYPFNGDGAGKEAYGALDLSSDQYQSGFYPPTQSTSSYSSNQCGQTPPNTPPPPYNSVNDPVKYVTPVQYKEQTDWASISYYELNQRVGEMFFVTSTYVTVDGFTNPSCTSNRFSLGLIPNIHRNSTVENTRKHIGKGVYMGYIGGEVIVECHSDSSIFLQSGSCNYLNNLRSNTVIKINTGGSIKIFSERGFADLLSQNVHRGYEAVFDLTKMCTFRISFVKGWGSDYHRRDITSTPCWIEVRMHGALHWLDQVLLQMGPPSNTISSIS